MKSSLVGLFFLIIFAIYLIIKLSKRSSSQRYDPKAKNTWNLLSEGKDPTDGK